AAMSEILRRASVLRALKMALSNLSMIDSDIVMVKS
ncbi:MAG: hypothetical protein ACI8SJ_002453, partial [Shewanella sp.]